MSGRSAISASLRAHSLTVALLLLALTYTLALCRYDGSNRTAGRVIDDTGRQLYQPVRVLQGQWFYRDFSLGAYQPGAPLWHALLFKLFGIKMSVERVSLALVGAGIAVLAYLLARRVMPAGWAILVYLLCLSWNVFSINVAYPSWYCTLFGLAAALLTLRYVERGGAWHLALAGGLVAASLAFKVSQGVYQAFGLALGLAWRSAVSEGPRRRPRRLGSLETVCAGALGLLGLAALWSAPNWLDFLYFGAPLAMVSGAVMLGRPRLAVPTAGGSLFFRELLWLGLGWAAVTAAWAAPTIINVGWKLFLHGTLLTPLRAAAMMQNNVSTPSLNGWLVLMAVVLGGSTLRHAERIRPVWVAGYALAVALIAIIPLKGQVGLTAILHSVVSTRELSLPLAFFFAVTAAWLMLWRREVEERLATRLGIILAFATWGTLVYFPLADIHHLSWAAPPLFVLLVFLGYWLSRRAQHKAAEPRRRWLIPLSIAALLAGLCAVQFYVVMSEFVIVGWPPQRVAYELLDAQRGDVYMPAAVVEEFRLVTQAVLDRTDANDSVFDTCGSFFNFIADRRNPTGIDFTWPGLHSPEEQRRMVEQLSADPPAVILRRTRNERSRPMGNVSVREAYPAVFEFIEQRYEESAKVGEYTIWSPK